MPDFACMPDELIIDSTIHQRAEIRSEIVHDLVAVIDEAESDEWPFATRVQVCRIGSDLFVTDGAHRVEACRLRNLRVNVSMKTCKDRTEAVLDGIRANGTHGVKRSAADTRKAVYSAATMWPDWSNQVIANHMNVSAETVRVYRSEIVDGSQPVVRKGTDGKVRSSVGKSRKKNEKAVVADFPAAAVGLDVSMEVEPSHPVVSAAVVAETVQQPPQQVQLSIEQRYEQSWNQLVEGIDPVEKQDLISWVARFHGLAIPAKNGVLFEAEDEPVVPKRRRRKPLEIEFEQFWKAYPRKTNKLKAEKAMEKAFNLLTSSMEPEEAASMLVSAATLYAERCDPDPKFQMHPSSWLNAGRWSDSADSIGKKREDPAWAYGAFTEFG